jgi:hypothetical protein
MSCLSLPLFLSNGPADDKQGRVAAAERAKPAGFLVAAHLIAPLTDLTTLFSSIVPALPVRTRSMTSIYLVSAWKSMSGVGQTEKYSKRADIFRSSADNRHPRRPYG